MIEQSRDTTASRQVFALIRACARTAMTPAHQAEVHTLLQQPIEGAAVGRMALFHGILPLVYHNLKPLAPHLFDASFAPFLDILNAARIHTLFLRQELAQVATTLQDADIRTLTFKGPALGLMAYRDVNLRPFTDLDLLLPAEDLDRTLDLLATQTYTLYSKIAQRTGLRRKFFIWQTGQVPVRRGGNTFNLDLHVSLMPPLYYYADSFDDLWGRSIPVAIAGTPVQTLGLADHLLLLCFHGEKNRWESLRYVCDLSELIQAQPSLDWDEVVRRAEYTEGTRILSLGLFLAQHIMGTPLPPEITARVAQDRVVTKLGTHLAKQLPERSRAGETAFWERIRLHLQLQSTFGTKARYCTVALLRRLMNQEL